MLSSKSSSESLYHCRWNACGGLGYTPDPRSDRLPLMPLQYRMVEGLVDHGVLLQRSISGSTITGSENESDYGEHSYIYPTVQIK